MCFSNSNIVITAISYHDYWIGEKVFAFFLRFLFFIFYFSTRTGSHLCMHHLFLSLDANDLEDKGSPPIEVRGFQIEKSCETGFLDRHRRRTFSRSVSWAESETNDSQRELSPVNKVGGVW